MAKTKVHRVDVVTDPKTKTITLPPELGLRDAIMHLTRKHEEEETEITVKYEFDAFPLEGAYGLQVVLTERYGFALSSAKQIRTMFGTMQEPPEVKRMQVGVDKYAQVLWGQFEIPNIPRGLFETGATMEEGDIKFLLQGRTLQKYRGEIDAIAQCLRDWLAGRSPYKGKAITVQFNAQGKLSPDYPPKFLDVQGVEPEGLILNEDVQKMVDAVVYGVIEEREKFGAFVNLSRGAVFHGPYGTGKTLCAMIAARKCEENGWTFFYVENPRDLLKVLKMAKRYAPAMVFVEDIDLLINNRDLDTANRLINEIDGVTSKNAELGLIMTSNRVEDIAKVLIRPGRANLVLEFTPPNAEAVGRLIRYYAGDALPEDADISEACRVMDGQIPAAITECVERAKILALRETGKPDITPDALLVSGLTLVPHLDLLKPREEREGIDYHLHEAAHHIRAIVGGDPTEALERFFKIEA
jgi:transitional endoplasmic reticulum ATPase